MTSFWLRFAGAMAVLLALVTVRASNAADPIRIGYIGPLTGIFAQAGKDMLDGLKLSLDQANHEAAGRKIELIAEDSEGNQLPTLFLTTPDDLTKRKPAKWILRSNFAASQLMHPLGDYAAKTLKYKKVAVIAMDNPFGHEQIGGFQRVFEDAGGRVIQRLWVPLNALDFAPYLSQISKGADSVCAVFVAGQAVRFV